MNRQTALLSVLAAVLVVALWWLFIFSPGQEDLTAVEEEIAAAETEQASLQARVAELEAVRQRAPETEAAIARLESLVPLDPALPGALRQLEAAAEDAGVLIRSLATSRPTLVEGEEELHEIVVNLNVEGSYFQVVDFLRRVEDPTIMSRALNFTSVSLNPLEYPTLSVALTGELYAALQPVPVPEELAADGEEAADGADAEGADATADETPTDGATVDDTTDEES